MFGAWGRLVYRFRWLVLLVSLAVVAATMVAVVQLSTSLSSAYQGDPDAESSRALRLIGSELPSDGGATFTLIFTAKDPALQATDPAFAAAVDAALTPLRDDARIAAITQSPNFVSRDGRRLFVGVATKDTHADAAKYYEELRAEVQSERLDILSTGKLSINADFSQVTERDLRQAEVIGLPIALVILLAVFGATLWRTLRRTSLRTAGLALALTCGTLAVALIPLLVGGFAIVGGLAGIYALAHRREMSLYSLNIASMIGLGVAIDYSLFVISRFLEEVPARPVKEAIARTVATTGKAIACSGLTVTIGVAGLLFYHSAMLNAIGLAAMLVVATAVFYGLTFLPALLAITGNGIVGMVAGRRSQVESCPATTDTRPSIRSVGGPWHALALGVMRRPWCVLLPLLALLLVAGSPFLRLRLGSGDVTVLPGDVESRQGYDLLVNEFPGSENTSISVVVHYPDGQALTADHVGRLHDYVAWLGTRPDVARVQNAIAIPGPDGTPLPKARAVALLGGPREALPQELQDGLHRTIGQSIVLLTVLTPRPAESDEARTLVNSIRAGGPDTGGIVLVTGQTAITLDTIASLRADTKWAVLFIVVATYVVLFLLLGSVLLPLKAVAMNLLSISASYGALVWIFQEGHLSGALGFTPGPIEPIVPVLMFCLLFGLSMDYEVLLLSRMKEEFDRRGDNRAAVATGLERTGQLITGAAAIMVAVFAAFALADIVVIKAIGLGMALAIATDALIVRTLIIPATMRLLGTWNWWAPAPLARLHRRLGLAEHRGGEHDTPALPAVALVGVIEPEPELVGAGSGER